jgi:hypothetical protein
LYEEPAAPLSRLLGRNWFKCYRYFNAGLQGPYNGYGRYVRDRRISGDMKRDRDCNFTVTVLAC